MQSYIRSYYRKPGNLSTPWDPTRGGYLICASTVRHRVVLIRAGQHTIQMSEKNDDGGIAHRKLFLVKLQSVCPFVALER